MTSISPLFFLFFDRLKVFDSDASFDLPGSGSSSTSVSVSQFSSLFFIIVDEDISFDLSDLYSFKTSALNTSFRFTNLL